MATVQFEQKYKKVNTAFVLPGCYLLSSQWQANQWIWPLPIQLSTIPATLYVFFSSLSTFLYALKTYNPNGHVSQSLQNSNTNIKNWILRIMYFHFTFAFEYEFQFPGVSINQKTKITIYLLPVWISNARWWDRKFIFPCFAFNFIRIVNCEFWLVIIVSNFSHSTLNARHMNVCSYDCFGWMLFWSLLAIAIINFNWVRRCVYNPKLIGCFMPFHYYLIHAH